jgi:hypothetical protein
VRAPEPWHAIIDRFTATLVHFYASNDIQLLLPIVIKEYKLQYRHLVTSVASDFHPSAPENPLTAPFTNDRDRGYLGGMDVGEGSMMLDRSKQGNLSSSTASVRKLAQVSRTGPIFNSGALQEACDGVVSAMRLRHDDSLEELQGAVEYLLDTVIRAKRSKVARGIRGDRRHLRIAPKTT